MPTAATTSGTRGAAPDVVVATGVMALGGATLLGATQITVPLSSNVVGPRVFPYAIGMALLLSGAFVLADALRGRLGPPAEGEDVDIDASTDWVALVKIVTALGVHIVLVDRIGWALAGALLFTLVAWSLGAKILRALATGVILGFCAQVLFVSALGVTLPAGPFAGVSVLDG